MTNNKLSITPNLILAGYSLNPKERQVSLRFTQLVQELLKLQGWISSIEERNDEEQSWS
jgi:hypothetical protein